MQPINFIRCAFPFNNSFSYYIDISASINTFFMEIIMNKRKKKEIDYFDLCKNAHMSAVSI